jgi:hypothetical protein
MDDRMSCFPSNQTLCDATGWKITKVKSVKRQLVEEKIIRVEQRHKGNAQITNMYFFNTQYISVYINLKDKGGEVTPVAGATPPGLHGDPPPVAGATTEVLTNEVLTNKKTRSVSEKETDEGAESFEQLWQAYGMKKGSKKNALARWSKLSRADRENIWATLDLYKRETVTEDTADRAGKFKPMRKHLERVLSARTWEAYIDRAADQKSEPPTPFDENYQKYLDWVKQHFPQVLQQTTQLSRAQFVAFKSTSYVKGVRDIGTNGEMTMFKQAHAEFCRASAEARKFSDVYEYHCSLIRYRVKVRQV